ncbi:unnamed protein product [Bemisia tabaci]|uniref:Uncharacterized protein n=1 Tax=Bemisia tabaci TaxID=7038 RepID=A0A9P0AKR6_BEMTA|nr:unnamed protein product [Bemisia tabaci]
MAEKLYEYTGFTGRLHEWRDRARERWAERDLKNIDIKETIRKIVMYNPKEEPPSEEEFAHITRRKTRRELIRVSAAVMGIEFSYAAETAFVSPILLSLGVEHRKMTLVWAISPIIGFFLTPILGSLSDRCRFALGRRRPFIILLSIGVLLGLILVPNGENIGKYFGDVDPNELLAANRTTTTKKGTEVSDYIDDEDEEGSSQPWGIFMTILGTILLDFDADACQSPSRAYLLDVTVPEDHARGLSTFTIMAGLGGCLGYALGGINWDTTYIGVILGGHVKAVFTLISYIFVACVTMTITSFREMPLDLVENKGFILQPRSPEIETAEEGQLRQGEEKTYGTLSPVEQPTQPEEPNQNIPPKKNRMPKVVPTIVTGDATTNEGPEVPDPEVPIPDLKQYLLSILVMPQSLKLVCATNLFCWMAHVCYSLYFTDYVGESVFKGDPAAIPGSKSRILYEEGVRFGCWGMSMYSLSCACYSMIIEKLIKGFGAKRVYVGGLLFYSSGMMLMAIVNHKVGVILFSWTAGVMYSTLFTMPYLLVAHYHSTNVFSTNEMGEGVVSDQVRGLGTDVAIVSSMVFMAQFLLSMCMGTIVSVVGSTKAVVCVASVLAFCGSLCATQVMYLDL